MFKDQYITQLQTWFTNLAPEGYTVKVVEEFGAGSSTTPKFGITVYVKFGVGSKQANTHNRINQPIVLTVRSEGDDFRTAVALLQTFFDTYSRTRSSLTIDDDAYVIWNNYTSPVVRPGVDMVGGYTRHTIDMMGVVGYSKDIIVGVHYYLKPYDDNIDYQEIQVVNPTSSYNTEPITPQYLGETTGKARIKGANNIYQIRLLLTKEDRPRELLYTAISGVPHKYVLKILFPHTTNIIFEINCVLTHVSVTTDSETGDNIIDATLMPLRS